MPIPQNREQLLHAITANYRRLRDELGAAPIERVDERCMEGHAKGTMMSVRDLAAYLLGWNALVLAWISHPGGGPPPAMPAPGYKWNELGKLAQKFYADDEDRPFGAILDDLDDAQARIAAFVRAQDDATLYGRPWRKRHTLGRMIQLNTASPYANALTRLRRWKKTVATTLA